MALRRSLPRKELVMPTLVMLSGEDSIAAGARIASMLVSRVVELCRNPQPVVGNCQPLRFQRILLLSCTVFPTWVEWLPIVYKGTTLSDRLAAAAKHRCLEVAERLSCRIATAKACARLLWFPNLGHGEMNFGPVGPLSQLVFNVFRTQRYPLMLKACRSQAHCGGDDGPGGQASSRAPQVAAAQVSNY